MAPKNPLKNERGVALLLALFSMVIMMFIAVEVSYESNVEMLVALQNINRIKAYYAAKSGMEISLLRVQLYKKVFGQFGSTLGDQKGILDLIWKFPLTWPPIVPDDSGSNAKDEVGDIVKESLMDASFSTTIEPEGGKIDLNDLDSPIEILQKQTKVQIQRLFNKKMEDDEEFAKKFRDFKLDEILNNIADYIDKDKESRNGGDESVNYREFQTQAVPPNRPFKTIDEIHMVGGMTDEFFNFLEPNITIWGSKGVNINYSTDELLTALDDVFSESMLKALNERKAEFTSGHFNEEEFKQFLQQQTNPENFNKEKYPFVIDAEYNFRITSKGDYQKAAAQIDAVVYDYEGIKQRLTTLLKTQKDQQAGTTDQNKPEDPNDPNNPNKKNDDKNQDKNKGQDQGTGKRPIPKGKPLIVYWYEK